MYINIRFKYFQMHIYGKFEYTKMYRMHTMKFVINTFVLLLYHKINISIKYIIHCTNVYIFGATRLLDGW